MYYSYVVLSINTIVLVNSLILQFQTSCNSSQFIDLENLIGSLHRYAPGYGHLIVRDMGLTSGQRKLLTRYENIQVISSKFHLKEKVQIINIKDEFILSNRTLSIRHNKNKYNYIDLIRKQFYLAIVIPFIHSQLDSLFDQINLNQIYSPCQNESHSIDLIFYYNKKKSLRLEQQIYQLINKSKCFNNIRFLAADLSEKENPYPIGSAIMWKKLFINEQFNNISLRSYGYTHFFLMEPDTRPIRSYWLDAIVDQIVNGHDEKSYILTKWWMIGSIYRGSKQIEQYFLHINGNALYHLSLNFIQFLEDVSIEYPPDSKQSCGYDLDLFLYLLKNSDKGKEFWHKFQFSDFIQNCWHTGCNETIIEFIHNNPNTYLIHGNKMHEKLFKHSEKKSYRIIGIVTLVLFLLFILQRFKYFCWKLSHFRNFLLRFVSKKN